MTRAFRGLLLLLSLAAYGALLLSANSSIAGGADSSGYLNAARLLARGRVSERIEMLSRVGLPDSDKDLFIPLGLNPGGRPGTMASHYSPGLPLHMAAAALLAGWRLAPFLVTPLSALALLVLMFGIARELGLSRGLAAAGSVWLAACPIFFGMAIQPMSDCLATAWVCAAILLGLKARRLPGWAAAAGAALGIAVLVRPTNALALPALWLALPARKSALAKAFLGGVPFVAVFLFYNMAAFGDAATTGYGTMLSRTMAPANALANIRHYGYWIPALLTPLVPLAWLAAGLDRRVSRRDRGLLLLWFGAFFLFYCFYEPFDDWWSTRFLLPGIPAMILAALLVARDLSALLRGSNTVSAAPRRAVLRVAGLLLTGAMVVLGVFHIRKFDLLSMKRGEAIYREASLWAAANTPPRGVLLTMQMSGALKYYTDRPIARWDAIAPERFPALRRRFEERGFALYALLWPFEEADFARRLPGNWKRIGTLRDIGLWRLD